MNDIEGATILVVEDELALSALISAAVEGAGCVVVGPATSVPEALALIEAQTISAAIVDLIVQGVFADAIVIELARRGIPFAVTTGIGADLAHPELRDALTITKPFQASHIQTVLEVLMTDAQRLADCVNNR